MKDQSKALTAWKGVGGRRLLRATLLVVWVGLTHALAAAGQTDSLVTGKVVDLDGRPVAGAMVTLHESAAHEVKGTTDASGLFALKASRIVGYEVSAETLDHRHGEVTAAGTEPLLRIVVKPAAGVPSAMEFVDKPDFTVAGVTDWTAVGGHGSDATLRTSEEMARQTAALKGPVAASKDDAVLRMSQVAEAEAHRVAGERAERLGDPLAAAHEEERATALDPSEQNYFTWGSELLLHRAIWQAAEVFAKGARLHPESQRLNTGWGAALFAGAKYDEAAAHLCEASDLDLSNRETYLFLGKLGLGSPMPEPCVSEKLVRFLRMHPDDENANFYEAMMLLKDDPAAGSKRPEELLERAVALNPRFAEAYLQLGILALTQHDNADAQADFEKAIAADASQAEAHYRLGVVYDRTGHPQQAKAEFDRHESLVKEQAEAVERERRQVKQFLVVLGGNPPASSTP